MSLEAAVVYICKTLLRIGAPVTNNIIRFARVIDLRAFFAKFAAAAAYFALGGIITVVVEALVAAARILAGPWVPHFGDHCLAYDPTRAANFCIATSTHDWLASFIPAFLGPPSALSMLGLLAVGLAMGLIMVCHSLHLFPTAADVYRA